MSLRKTIVTWLTPRHVLTCADLKNLVFGQQHIGTQDFFEMHYGQAHTIPLEEFPHYRFLQSNLDCPESPSLYAEYLEYSWRHLKPGQENFAAERSKKFETFIRLYRNIQSRQSLGVKAILRPLIVCKRPDGRYVLVNGNHRACAALALGLDVYMQEVSLPAQLTKLCSIPDERHDSKRRIRPPQSFYYEGRELVRGLRRDTCEWQQKIDPADLLGKTVLDLGCDTGVSSHFAAERGAERVVAVESSPDRASAAVCFNAYFCRPCHFIWNDLSKRLDLREQFDTVFCLSSIGNFRSPEAAAELIRIATRKVLYFEAHDHTSVEDYPYLLNKQNFSKIELAGHLSAKKHSRKLYRCEV